MLNEKTYTEGEIQPINAIQYVADDKIDKLFVKIIEQFHDVYEVLAQ